MAGEGDGRQEIGRVGGRLRAKVKLVGDGGRGRRQTADEGDGPMVTGGPKGDDGRRRRRMKELIGGDGVCVGVCLCASAGEIAERGKQ